MAQVPNSSLYAYQDGLVVTAAQLNQDIQVLQTALNDNYYRLLRSVTVNGTAYQLQGTSGIINNVNLNTDSTVSATSSSDSQGNITVTFSVASGAISSGKIANGAVGTAQLADLAVTQSKIANQAVGTTQIANNAVGVNQLDPSLVQQTGINLVQAKLAEAVLGLRNLLHPSQQSFTRASSAWRINGSAYVPSNVLRTEQGKFGQGAFIEEATTNLVPNSGFETVTTTATVFSDALTSYTGSTVPAPWTLQSGSFTFGASGVTVGANGSWMTSGNAAWKPIVGSDGVTKLSLTAKGSFAVPSTVLSGTGFGNGAAILAVNPTNEYRCQLNNTQFILSKTVNGTYTQLASVNYTPTASTTYEMQLALDSIGNLAATLMSSTGSTLTSTTATDTSFTGGFLIGVGGDTGVVISNASVTGPWANSWTIGGDSRIAWGLTQNAIGGKYSVSALGVAGVESYIHTSQYNYTSGETYTLSAYVNSTNLDSNGASLSINLDTGKRSSVITGTTSTNRVSVSSTAGSSSTAQSSLVIDGAGTVTFDNIQLEQKPYPTTYVEVTSAASGATATRNADSLSFNLANPLPSSWFGALVWKPNQSSLDNSNQQRVIASFRDSTGNTSIYEIGWFHNYFYLTRNGYTELDVTNITYNAGDLVEIFVKNDTSGNVCGLYISVNGGAISKTEGTSGTPSLGVSQIWIGSGQSGSLPCNGTIDFPIISDVIPTSDQITSLAQATDWGGTRDWAGALPDKVTVGHQIQIISDDVNGAFNTSSGDNHLTANAIFDGSHWKAINQNNGGAILTLLQKDYGSGRALLQSFSAGQDPGSVTAVSLLQALSGGYKVQSGQSNITVTTASTSVSASVPFPASFTSAPLVLCTLEGLGGNSNTWAYVMGYNPQTGSFTVVANSGVAQNIVFNWIAIGQ